MLKTTFAAMILLGTSGVATAQVSYFGSAVVGYNDVNGEYASSVVGAQYGNYALSLGYEISAVDHYEGIDLMRFEFYKPMIASGTYYSPLLVRVDVNLGSVKASVSYELDGGYSGSGTESLAAGISASLGGLDLSLAYQDKGAFIGCCGIEGTGSVFGATAEYQFGNVNAKAQYLTGNHAPFNETYNSAAVELSYSMAQAVVGARVVVGSNGSGGDWDATDYGVFADFSIRSADIHVFYDYYGGSVNEGRYGIDISHEISSDLVAYAGYANKRYTQSSGLVDEGAYVGVVYAGLTPGIEIGVSYSEQVQASSQDGYGFNEGISAFITASF